MELVELRAGAARLELAPVLGGGIAAWSIADGPVLRPRSDEVLSTRFTRGLGAYPLIPFSNRIAQGRFSWDGQNYQLPALFGGNAIHGTGWERAWSVSEQVESAASLILDYTPSVDWPFAFLAEQRFTLAADALEVGISVTNRHDAPAPFGIGLHPYFPRGEGCVLSFTAENVWLSGADMIPIERVAIPADWDHRDGRNVGSVALDNCFDGWRGPVTLHWPARGLTLRMTADPVFRHLVVFTPDGRDFLATEPVTNMNDGINREDGGMVTLAPGETLRGNIRFALS